MITVFPCVPPTKEDKGYLFFEYGIFRDWLLKNIECRTGDTVFQIKNILKHAVTSLKTENPNFFNFLTKVLSIPISADCRHM